MSGISFPVLRIWVLRLSQEAGLALGPTSHYQFRISFGQGLWAYLVEDYSNCDSLVHGKMGPPSQVYLLSTNGWKQNSSQTYSRVYKWHRLQPLAMTLSFHNHNKPGSFTTYFNCGESHVCKVFRRFMEDAYYEQSTHEFQKSLCTKINWPFNPIFYQCFSSLLITYPLDGSLTTAFSVVVRGGHTTGQPKHTNLRATCPGWHPSTPVSLLHGLEQIGSSLCASSSSWKWNDLMTLLMEFSGGLLRGFNLLTPRLLWGQCQPCKCWHYCCYCYELKALTQQEFKSSRTKRIKGGQNQGDKIQNWNPVNLIHQEVLEHVSP